MGKIILMLFHLGICIRDFIRLKDITLGYSLPRDFVNSIGVTGLKLTVRGTNLWTYTFDRNLKFDPEVDINGYSNLTTPL